MHHHHHRFLISPIFLSLLIIFATPSCALYKDQVGKFDWSVRHFGCPHQIFLGRIGGDDALLLVSKKNVIGRIDLESGKIVWRQVNQANGPQLNIMSIDASTIQVAFEGSVKHRTFDVHSGILQWQKSKKVEVTEKNDFNNPQGLIPSTFDSNIGRIRIQHEGRQVEVVISDDASIHEVKVLLPRNADEIVYKVLVSRDDCRLEMFDLSLNRNSSTAILSPRLIWTRWESLADISGVQLIDMPLSEAQAQIETEFNLSESAFRSFMLRIRSQFEQIHRFLLSTAERFIQILEMALRGELRYSAVIRQLFDIEPTAADGRERQLERDYFNLRKVIVVTTLEGALHGLSNDDGRVLWSQYLGEQFVPYKNSQSGKSAEKVPLFLLRGTSYYQWPSKAAVVFNEKNSTDSIILIFSPITGERIELLKIRGGLLRVEQWPFADAEQLHPLLLIRNANPSKPELWPQFQSGYQPPKPVYLLSVHKQSGTLAGSEVDLARNVLAERWITALPGFDGANGEIIYTMLGKPVDEQMHSQGKVLGDRSVLYKYNNPNLIAILSANPKQLSLRLHLVDLVSGQLVYSGHYSKALPPFHLVHCENWLVLTYWNEKARRTEVGVLELFEGLQQTNAGAFDSTSGMNKPVRVVAQSYIFPQGISSMAATHTGEGLTSRSIIMALPFGGVLEISRRFLDARRPLQMTPELREEMLIPYMPELPLATEELINYNQTTLNVRGIRTAPSGLESTSLAFVFGLDLFYTRVTPSGTFDILKDDFDYVLISGVMLLLIAASVVCKRLWRYQSIQQAWA